MPEHKLKVLIIEDSPFIAERMIDYLKELDTIGTISYAGNFKNGLGLVEREMPDIVLLDINLPDKSGIYLLQLIRNNKMPVAVIVITNEANEMYRRVCLRMGADAFLDKSNDFEQLRDLIYNFQYPKAPIPGL